MANQGLLFVIGECGPKVSVDEFNDWYDNEHAPKRLTVPGFSNAVRYKAIDEQTPTWLAMYDLVTSSVPYHAPYKALSSQPSEKDKSIIPRMEFFTRSVWELISEKSHPTAPSGSTVAKHILIVTCLAPPESAEDFNKWYEDEHIPEILRLGCFRARRYKLMESVDLTKKTNPSVNEVHNYLAIYDWDNDDYFNTTEFKASVQTPWAVKALAPPVQTGLRRFNLHKDIQRATL
ncbi:hypothetical protein CVT25_014466 [Psilocybe cyanescens]|uniref:EthD domain-containing protein n=1 Tax=Psilocybe cyanescens TaxID=93625 RepID=A0A409XRK0_PSICY|nr:hypothetical protein CVT25_014466 [Psilocybe cyanescens]